MKKNGNGNARLDVLKTYKIYINGQYPRTESGRYYPLMNGSKTPLANVCLCSRKDARDAVLAARGAFSGWGTRKAFNRGQILYRIAEMLEQRKAEFIDELSRQGQTPAAAKKECADAIDRLVYFAGWADKYQQVFSSVNPVNAPYFNFSLLEPTGVISIIAPEESALLGLVSLVAPAICGGNTCVVLASRSKPLSAVTFAEVLGTSDLPAGVVNILTGSREELLPHLTSHMDVNAVVYAGDSAEEISLTQTNCALNVKRFSKHDVSDWAAPALEDPYLITELQEVKTTWHPIER